MKPPIEKLALAYRTIAELEGERDALAQRCRELEHMLKHARMDADTHYADTLTLRAEVEQLREIRKIASQCAENGGYLCSADLIELRELLKKITLRRPGAPHNHERLCGWPTK